MGRTRLMTTPPQFVLSRLSRQLYLDFLAKARARDFAFVRFQDFLPGTGALPPRYIALRHDIDFAPATTVVLVLNTVALALQKLHGHLFAMLTAPAAPTTHPPLLSPGALRGEPRGS